MPLYFFVSPVWPHPFLSYPFSALGCELGNASGKRIVVRLNRHLTYYFRWPNWALVKTSVSLTSVFDSTVIALFPMTRTRMVISLIENSVVILAFQPCLTSH
mgnify:CR=1 FL=1